MITTVTAIMIAMSTILRRSVQGMVKAVADQMGFQNGAEQQNGSSGGYLVNMTIQARREQKVCITDRLGNITYSYPEYSTETQTFVLSNSGQIDN